jgi:uncharacterized protein (DUF58 family)
VRGVGSEFVGIREYTPDDDTRKINWMATARAEKPMTNVYDVERDQMMILAIDTGRFMDAPMGQVTRLDRAVESAAALAQVALSSGDRVGIILYGVEVSAYLAPGKGAKQLSRILEVLYNAKFSRTASSPDELASFLGVRARRRALICLLSYLDGEAMARDVGRALRLTARRHAILYASLQNPDMETIAAQTPEDMPELYTKAAAIYRGEEEQRAIAVLKRIGIDCFSADPTRALATLVKQYMTFKKQMRI